MAFPPVLLIHGAASGAWVWKFWRQELAALGWQPAVLDLRGHGRSLPADFAIVTMEDYVHDVESVAEQVAAREGQHPAIVGWSMGGLAAIMYAVGHPETPALVLMSPSPPRQVIGHSSSEEVRKTPAGPYGPELYGIYPDDLQGSRPALADLTDDEARAVLDHSRGQMESGFARRQRRRGISIPPGKVICPTLVVFGEQDRSFPPAINRRLALYLAGDTLAVPDCGHWGIVYHEEAVKTTAPKVDAWLRDALDRT